MKVNKNNWDVSKKNFYDNLKNRKTELEAEIAAAKEASSFCEFDDFERDNYEYRFLKDILGTNKCFGTQFDYCGLIHLPKIKWTDSEDTEHIHTLIGTHTPGYYGFLTPGNVTSANDTITVDIVEPNESCTEEDDRKISISVNTDKVQTALKNEEGYAADTYLKVVNNGTTEEPNLGLKWVNLGGLVQDNLLQWDDTSKEIFKGEEGKYTIVDDIKLGDTTVLNRISTETTRASEAEKSNTTLINNETTRAESAEQEISEALVSEQSERMEADAEVEGKIPTVFLKSIEKKDSTVSITDASGTVTSFITGGGSTGGVTQEYVDAQDDLIKESVTELSQNLSDNYYNKDAVDEKIATGTGLYLGWLENDAQELPSESDIGTWIDAQEQSAWKPSYPTKFTNNDYIFVWFSTQYVYWRCKYVQESGSTEHSWKKDLEFNDDVVGLTTRVKAVEDKVTTLNDTTIPAIQDSVSTLENSKASTQYVTESVAAEKEERINSEATLQTNINVCEKIANKTTSLTTASTDTQYPSAKATFDAIDEVYEDLSENKLDATKCTYSTTAPTEAIADNGIHIVYLESEPETKYSGYIYMIKED